MIRNTETLGILMMAFTLALSSCGVPRTPSGVIEEYLDAMVDKNVSRAVNLSCSTWEENAKTDGAGFRGVEVSLEDALCSVIDESAESATVSCSGKFVFQYAGGEIRELNLDRPNYSLVQESGVWKMCGHE